MATTNNPDSPPLATRGARFPGVGGAIMPARGAIRRMVRSGAIAARDVGTDVTNQLDASIPTFGNVLQSIGDGVATSQAALDHGVIETVNELNGTTIKVVTDVVEVLNDDGLPDVAQTNLVTKDVSVLNFFSPTIHEWKNVSLAMDLSIESFHSEQGLQFSQHQHSESDLNTGLFWGFLGWFDWDTLDTNNDVVAKNTNDLAWQSGQVRVDAVLGPRKTGKFPVAASVSVGPQIFVTQGAVQEQQAGGATISRSVDVLIEVRKASGEPNPNQNISLQSGGLLPSFTNGSATDAAGKVALNLKRTLIPGFTAPAAFQVTVLLGQMRKSFTVTL